MDLCLAHSQRKYLQQEEIISLNVPECMEIGILERLGFVVSVDTPSQVSLRVKGHLLTDDGKDFFCAQGGIHV